MIKQIIQMIWRQRRSNAWIFAEILIVLCVLWVMLDALFVNTYVYNQPLGYDIENTWRFKLGNLNSTVDGYVSDEQRTTNETEDLLKLMDQIRRNPEVEEVCAAFYSCPYSWGNSWNTLIPVDSDTTGLSSQSFHRRNVTPEYFALFRIKDKYGDPIIPQLQTGELSIIISEDLETRFYKGQEGKGRKVKFWGGEQEVVISAVSQPIRDCDYEASEPCYYNVLSGSELKEVVDGFRTAANAELCVRMKQSKTTDEMYQFLGSIGDRLTVNNLYVYGVKSLAEQREERLTYYEDESKNKMSLMTFMLINVFFGIVGTFWIRTESRKSEMGVRVAMGSNKGMLYRFMNLEAVSLLGLTIPFVALFIVNAYYLDYISISKLPLNPLRIFIVTGASFLLMGMMICLGVWMPARKAVSIPPSEALRDE